MELIRDPDRLVYFLSDLREDNMDVCRHPALDDANDKVVHRVHLTARVLKGLNALARLLVHKSGQVFAVGIVPPSLTQASARLIISENSDVTEAARNHARHILQGLHAARQLMKEEILGGDPPLWNWHNLGSIPSDIADPFLHKLAEIETTVVRHSWLKMRKRFCKADRHTAFFNVHDAILAQNAQDATASKLLEAQYGWPQADDFREEFVLFGEVLRDLHETLQPLSDEQVGEVQSDEHIGLVRSALVDVYVLSKRLRARMPKVFDMCAAYHADLVAQSNAWQGKAKANTTQAKAKANSAQDIDFNHWNDKVPLTYTDFRQVRDIIGSPTLDAVLTEEIKITAAVQSPAEASVSVTVDNLKDALGTNLGVDDDDLGDFLRTRLKKGTDERDMS